MDLIMRRPSRPEAKIPGFTAPDDEEPASRMRICEAEGCRAEAHYPAPRSRDALRDYIWFCLEHVRAYNKSWNYYDGMSAEEIESDRHSKTFWDRPTWPLSTCAPR